MVSQGTKDVHALTKSMTMKFRKGFSKELVNEAYKHAMGIAPRKTGELRRAIKKVTREKSGDLILSQPEDPRNRPYHLWHHGIKAPSPTGKNGAGKGYDLRSGKYRPKTGIPDFMDKTYWYMERRSTEVIEAGMRKVFGGFKRDNF